VDVAGDRIGDALLAVGYFETPRNGMAALTGRLK
jgi:hypothetical protein